MSVQAHVCVYKRSLEDAYYAPMCLYVRACAWVNTPRCVHGVCMCVCVCAHTFLGGCVCTHMQQSLCVFTRAFVCLACLCVDVSLRAAGRCGVLQVY